MFKKTEPDSNQESRISPAVPADGDDALFEALGKSKKTRKRERIRRILILVLVLAVALIAGISMVLPA